MAYEKPGYRLQLEALRERHPDPKPMNLKDAAEVAGINWRTLRDAPDSPARKIGPRKYIVTLEALANFLAQ